MAKKLAVALGSTTGGNSGGIFKPKTPVPTTGGNSEGILKPKTPVPTTGGNSEGILKPKTPIPTTGDNSGGTVIVTIPVRYNEYAPTTPGSISVPDGLKGGTSVTVSWGGSSDANGNLAGYRLERSVNGGGYTQVYQGGATSSVQAITHGWKTVAFRVKAYDTANWESGYATSPTRNIFNNIAPTAPSSIAVPDKIEGGSTITVSWGTASDSNNNLTGYRLERSVNGGGYTRVFQGNALSSSQAIAKGWNTVAFRVKAYDAEGAEGVHTASAVRTIINNDPPTQPGTITCDELRAGKPLVIRCGASTDPDGDAISYVWERRTDADSFAQLGVTSMPSISNVVPSTVLWYQIRVKAVDSRGKESAYQIGEQRNIRYNAVVREDSITLEVTQGQSYHILVRAQKVKWFTKMSLRYDSGMLATRFANKGELVINESEPKIPAGKVYTGVIYWVELVALRTGSTRITLS